MSYKEYLNKLYRYKFKAKVIASGLCTRIKKYDKSQAIKYLEGIVDHDIESQYFDDLNVYGLAFMDEARKINDASYHRVKRLRKRIVRYLNMGVCTFLSLTFDDEKLNSTNVQTRRKLVSMFLKSISTYYVANIDFGVDDMYTHREHYHAICVGNIRHVDTKWWQDHCGYTWVETIRHGVDDDKVLAKYISKLTNHAIKDSTKRQFYIYSRC